LQGATGRDAFADRYGPWAVVAGASEGIGRAWAQALASRGLSLVLIARRPGPLEETAQALRDAHGVQVRSATLDLASERIAQDLAPALEGVDVGLLVYNAGVSVIAPFHELPVDAHLHQLYVNCRGPILLARALAPAMVERGRGGIVLMSSAAGFVGSRLLAIYAATKAFDTVLAEGLAADLARSGVDVLGVVAGATRTPNFERQMAAGDTGVVTVMQPEDVVKEALAALGSRPLVVAGRANRMAAFLLTRVLSRRRAGSLMAGANARLAGLT
jgi:short-subunit dehydrogenase